MDYQDQEVPRNKFFDKFGKIIFPCAFMARMSEKELKVFFSEFYPLSIESGHSRGWQSEIIYYGCSSHFREVPPGEITPEYEAIFTVSPEERAANGEIVRISRTTISFKEKESV